MADILDDCAARVPGARALVTRTDTHTFDGLAARAGELSERLEPETRVVVRIDNDPASVVALCAVWRAGCSVVAVSAAVPPAETRRRAEVTGASAVLVPGGAAGTESMVEHTGSRRRRSRDEAAVMFTSGTTGVPKGVSLTFSALRHSLSGLALGNALPAHGRLPRLPDRSPRLVAVPIAHMGGLLGLLTAWWTGKPALLCGKFSVPVLVELAGRHRLGVIGLTPAMVWDLVDSADAAPLPGVTAVTVGTAALPEHTRLAFEQHYRIPVLRNYGQTEFAGAIAFERPDDVAAGIRPPLSVGRVAPGVRVVICDDAGTAVPTGATGEIVAASAAAMSGYLDADGAPNPAGNWLRTGDLGRLDDAGFLYVLGRTRDMVVCGGFNVYPVQVERALNELPEILDSAVAGLPDDRLGEIPVGVVVLGEGTTLDPNGIRDRLRSRLAAWELPRRLVEVPRIPRLPSGKVDRAGVAAMFGESAS